MSESKSALAPPARPFAHDARAISASKLRDWKLGCRARYRWSHGDAEAEGRIEGPIEEPLALRVGSYVHRVLERVGREMLRIGAVVTPQEPTLASTIDHEIEADREAADVVVANRAEALLEREEVLVALDWSRTTAIELPWTLDLGDGWSARGIFDRVDEDREWNAVEVVDWKTGRVLGGPLEEDAQALLYLAGARALWPEAKRVRFTQVWLALLPVVWPRSIDWTPDLDRRARAAGRSVLEEIHREIAWAPLAEPSVICRTCPHVARCPLYAGEEDRGEAIVVATAESLVLQTERARTRTKVYDRIARAGERELRALLELEGEEGFLAADRRVAIRTTRGRRSWGRARPDDVAAALRGTIGRTPPLESLTATRSTAVEAFVRGLGRVERARAHEALDTVAPRQPTQRLVIEPAGAASDEELGEGEEEASDAA